MSIVDELIALLGFEVTGEEEARRFERRIDSLNDGLDKFATNAGRLAGAASLAVAGAFGVLGRSVIDTSAQFESYQATLETIEGTAEKARASLDWIADFGKTTPYDVAQVTEAFVALKAYGIDPIADDALRTLGDTASAMGKPLTQAVEAFADAATGEFERLKEFGIKAKTEGDNVTFAWTKNGQEMTETVKKSSNEIRAFLLETMGDRFSGAMDRQSRTWNGMMSNLGDTWTDFKRRIGEAGFFSVVTGHLESLLGWISRLDGDGTLDRWAENLSSALSTAANFTAMVAERIGKNIMFIAENFDALEPILIPIAALFGILIARAFPLITAFVVLSLAIDDFFAYLQGGESYIGDFIEKIKELTGVSDGVAQAIAGVTTALGLMMASLILKNPFRFLSTMMKGAFLVLFKDIPRLIKTLGRFLFMGLAALAPLIMKGAAAAFALLSNPIGWAILLAGVAAGLIYYFWDEIKAAWEATKDKATEIFSTLKDWILEIDWRGIGVDMMNSIWNGMKEIGESIKGWFVSLFPKNFVRLLSEDDAQRLQSNRDLTRSFKDGGGFDTRKEVFDPNTPLEFENLKGNMSRLDGANSVSSITTDSRQDNRQFPSETNVTVNQTVTQATDAPRRAADATGTAVLGAVPAQRTQAEMEPSF